MELADLLRETLETDDQDVSENERTPTPVRRFGVRLHTAGLSIRETVELLELLGIDRSHGAVWNWVQTLSEAQSDPPTFTRPSLVQPIRNLRSLRTAFLHRLTEKHDLADTGFLVDAGGYLTALARHELSGRLDYRTRNHIEKWFQTVTMRIDRFHTYWRGSQSSARQWLQRFRHHYNHERPNQALDGRTPAEEVQN
ncbi:integrase core domain-containing protein [Halomicrobium sp. LC1Hm]|uniref:integrase core domain-containing protein n=1 Tax=Halomicrobium sp. LC1Hm TaxID=2610902 RepID=UPI0012984C67|nr:DDE-type integrase/transposase/recombinase [Halomicrobium sp. LC1Hm]QGA81366.1 Transposase [Halomicrobium sp. LC1Hm]